MHDAVQLNATINFSLSLVQHQGRIPAEKLFFNNHLKK
jgi:hypothetical protein